MSPIPLEPVTDVLARVLGGADDVGAFADVPVLVIELDGAATDDLVRLAPILGPAPVVVVGVSSRTDLEPAHLETFDVLVTRDDPRSRPWIPIGMLETIVTSIRANPAASVTLAQLLRVGERSSAPDAVVAESWVYSLLQSGTEHRAWLDPRRDRERRPRPDHPVVLVDRDDDELHITLDRPEVRNAYGTRMRDELVEALELVAIDPSIDRAIVRGNGPAFCSGGDLDEFGTAPSPVPAHLVRTTRNAGLVLTRIADRVEFHVHGPCVGAGVELPAFAHTVIAAPDATFRLPEIAMGLVPGAGGTSSIPRRIGRHRTAAMALLAAPIDVTTAHAWGLVDEIR